MLKKSFFVILIILLAAFVSNAQVPQLINYQGMLTDAAGNPINGTHTIQFFIYNSATGGTALWSESHNITIADGLFNVRLGSTTPIPYSVFDGSDKYLSLKVSTDPEMSPRKRLVSVGYSFRAYDADKIDGMDASEFVQTGQANSISTGMVQDNAVTEGKILPDIVSSISEVKNDGGNIELEAGSNITITPDDANNKITIAASGGGGGDITAVTAGTGLSGGGTSGDVTLNVEVPLQLSSSISQVIKGTCTSSGNYGYLGGSNQGMLGYSSSQSGVVGQSIYNYGIVGLSSNSYGVYGYNSAHNNNGYLGGNSYAVYGQSSSNIGVYGKNDSNDNYGELGTSNEGVFGKNNSSGNWGRLGISNYGIDGYSSSNIAVHGKSNSNTGVYGINFNSGNYGELGTSNYGVYGKSTSGYGVWGERDNSCYGYLGGNNIGVAGEGDYQGVRGYSADGSGVMGTSSTGFGVYGQSSSGYAGYFVGDVYISGNLYKSGGSFMIDHPLDPQNKYLYHSFVESPDMMNIYNGNVTLDATGQATVELPDWFEALNKDFRYQLTAIGAPGPNLYLAEEISGSRFRIAGGKPYMKVSWQVTGIRQDAFANAHRIQVEVEKTGDERGRYLHPQEHGMPESMGINYKTLTELKGEQK